MIFFLFAVSNRTDFKTPVVTVCQQTHRHIQWRNEAQTLFSYSHAWGPTCDVSGEKRRLHCKNCTTGCTSQIECS